ncbi:MAG: D-alanyl-D-alanine carboxypeptidase, partial [Candidatus Baltobacteraceae bacterium]
MASAVATNALTTPRPAPPASPWSPAQAGHLRATLRSALAPAVEGMGNYSFAVIDAGGRLIYDDQSSHAVTPASVLKLVVAHTALDLLGPAYRFHTIAVAEHGFDAGGAIDGNLWIVGSGDPSLRSSDLRAGIASLRRQGLRSI